MTPISAVLERNIILKGADILTAKGYHRSQTILYGDAHICSQALLSRKAIIILPGVLEQHSVGELRTRRETITHEHISAIVAGWEAINRLIHPQPITFLWAVAVAGVIGFLGNEACAIFRIRVGREIESAALIADGYHARTDGLTSLAVVVGAAGVWWGFPLADPIIGLLITIAIFGIVWQSSKAVFTRLLDGVEPDLVGKIRHATGHAGDAANILAVRARWLGHRLTAELDVAVDGNTTVKEAEALSERIEHALLEHLPALAQAHVRARPLEAVADKSASDRGPVREHAGVRHDDHD